MWGLRKSQNFVIFKKDTSTLFSASLEITVKFLKASVNSYTCPELVEGMDLKFFQDKKVTVMGLGLHGGGVGVAKFFANLGARVLVTDLKSKTKLAPSKSEAKRLILQKGVKIDGKVQKDWKTVIEIKKGRIIQVGKRKFARLG